MSRLVTNRPSFIHKAKQIHGKKYKYCGVIYINSKEKVKIWCNTCGEYFWQAPLNHLSGKGCFKCGHRRRIDIVRDKFSSDTKSFIYEARKIHKNKFDYCKVNYTNNRTKVIIICKIHGKFEQCPQDHLNSKYGCRKCSFFNQRLTVTEFENKVKQIHSGTYLYYRDYIDTVTEIKIKCKKCGRHFYQIPQIHMQGCGCIFCKGSNTQNEIYTLITKLTRLKFLYNIKLSELRGLELDMYNKYHNLAIEYNGEQHYPRYRSNWGYFKLENILACQKRDRKKKYLCKKHNIDLVIIPCYDWELLKDVEEKKQYLMEKIRGF